MDQNNFKYRRFLRNVLLVLMKRFRFQPLIQKEVLLKGLFQIHCNHIWQAFEVQ